MSSELYILIGTLLGATIGSVTTIITTIITKRYEHRRVLLEIGLENWKQSSSLVKSIADSRGKSATYYPLDSFLIHQAVLTKALFKKNLSPKKLRKMYDRSNKLNDELKKIDSDYKKEVAKNGD